MAKKKSIESESFDSFLERQYGKNVLIKADDMIHRKRDILPTVLSLDIGLNGGIPDGVTVLLSGKPKAGKSTICLEILKNAIDLDRPAFYMNIERRISKELLGTINGLDTSKLKIIQSTEEKNFTCEDWLNILERTIKDNKKAVIVLDSLAMLSTLAESSEAIGESRDMAGSAKLLSSFFRRMQQIIDNNDIILIFISQLITNRDPNGKKWVEKGGMGVQYSVSVWLNVNWVKLWDKDTETNSPLGQDLQINVVCSALGRPYLPCAVPLRFGSGIDRARDIATNAENLGVIEKAGSWYSITTILDKDGNAVKMQGMKGICEFLNNNPDKMKQLENEIRKMLLSNSIS